MSFTTADYLRNQDRVQSEINPEIEKNLEHLVTRDKTRYRYLIWKQESKQSSALRQVSVSCRHILGVVLGTWHLSSVGGFGVGTSISFFSQELIIAVHHQPHVDVDPCNKLPVLDKLDECYLYYHYLWPLFSSPYTRTAHTAYLPIVTFYSLLDTKLFLRF